MSSTCDMHPTINGVKGAVYALVNDTLVRLTRERLLSGEIPENLQIVYGRTGHVRAEQIRDTLKAGNTSDVTTVAGARASLKARSDTEPRRTDIHRLAAMYEFAPTRKQAKPYSFSDGGEPGGLPPMSYTVARTEQRVVTITADGKETENTAAVGDVIMSGPSGENYVVKAAKFPGLYDGEIGTTVIPNQAPRDVARYTGSATVVFTASWGEDMILKPGDYLVASSGAYYRIARAEYEETYNPPGDVAPNSADTFVASSLDAVEAWRTEFATALRGVDPTDLEALVAVAEPFVAEGFAINEEIHLGVYDLGDERLGLWHHNMLNKNIGASGAETMCDAAKAGMSRLAAEVYENLLEDLACELPKI